MGKRTWYLTKDNLQPEFLASLVSPNVDEFLGSKSQANCDLTLRCVDCGDTYQRDARSTISKEGQLLSPLRCPHCSRVNARKTTWATEEFRQKRSYNWNLTKDNICQEFLDALVSPSIETILGSSTQSNMQVVLQCTECGKVYSRKLNKVITKQGSLGVPRIICSHCKYSESLSSRWEDPDFRKKQSEGKLRYYQTHQFEGYRSNLELQVDSYIQSLGLETKHDRTIIFPQEIDILIPSKGVGIEFNGIYYHKGEREYIPGSGVGLSENYHSDKFLQCRDKGIHLIQISEMDWCDPYQQDKIKQYLHDLLTEDKQVYYARKLTLDTVEPSVAKAFYEDHHLQGCNTQFPINYGLYLGSELISCMSFGKSRVKGKTNPEGYYELHRYCIKSNSTVLGGAERLFKHFISMHDPIEIKSFSDNDYFSGKIYGRLNFKEVGQTRVYCWVNLETGDVRPREKCQLKVLKGAFPESYEEAEFLKENKEIGNRESYIMELEDYYKYTTAGRTKWIWRKEGIQ